MDMCSGCYAYCFIATRWVNKQYGKIKKYEDEVTEKVKNGESKGLLLTEILSTKDGVDLYAYHLVKEFNIENLLFIFEMMIIKNQLISSELSVQFIIIINTKNTNITVIN